MVRDRIGQLLSRALTNAQISGHLPKIDPDDLGLERSRVPEADYSSTLAMRLARASGTPPTTIANAIVDSMEH